MYQKKYRETAGTEYRKKKSIEKSIKIKKGYRKRYRLCKLIIFEAESFSIFLNARQKYRLVRRGRFLFVLTARLHHRSLPRIQILIAAWAIFCLELPEAVESCPSVRKAGMPMLCRVAAYSVPPCRAVSYRVVRPAIGASELSQWKRLAWPY